MKSIITLTICLSMVLIFIGGCKKDGSGSNPHYEALIRGTWELRKTSGSQVIGEQLYPPGNGNILKFIDSRFERYVNGALTQSGQFEIVRNITVNQSVCLEIPTGQFTNQIIYDNNSNGDKVFVQISNNKLTFISGCYSLDAGYRSEYEKY